MKITLNTWRDFRDRYGDFDARRRLQWVTRGRIRAIGKDLSTDRPCPLEFIQRIVHGCTWRLPADNRRRYADVIRQLLRVSRTERERINGFCAPGVSLQRLP